MKKPFKIKISVGANKYDGYTFSVNPNHTNFREIVCPPMSEEMIQKILPILQEYASKIGHEGYPRIDVWATNVHPQIDSIVMDFLRPYYREDKINEALDGIL